MLSAIGYQLSAVWTTGSLPAICATGSLPAICATGSLPASVAEATGPPGDGGIHLTTMLFVFMLATFIGFEVIRRVSPLLHTPLMSLTNAISAIAIVGSITITGTHGKGSPEPSTTAVVLGFIAIFASMTNVVSGFLITDRMLKMFKKRTARPS